MHDADKPMPPQHTPAPAAPAFDWGRQWALDPHVTFLNHGSFGACPMRVLRAQQDIRDQMEAEPVQFFLRDMPRRLDMARAELAAFLGADPAGMVFVSNATSGVNAVLGSLALEPGDELLTTSHAYGACRQALEYTARRARARLLVVDLPLAGLEPAELTERIAQAATSRTRLALIDHVTSPTALVFLVREIVQALETRGIPVIVDGAHAPGMIPLALDELGASYYTGNCHKWLCAPKGAGFLYARADRRQELFPTAISHGHGHVPPGRSALHARFDWTGTQDVSPWLCVPEALRFMASLMPGGWPAIMARNHAVARQATRMLAERLGLEPVASPDEPRSMMALLLPGSDPGPARPALQLDPLQDRLFFEHGIEIPVIAWPDAHGITRRMVRISAQLYNRPEDYERLAEALQVELPSI